MTPDEAALALIAFEADARPMIQRYVRTPVEEVDWDRFEMEVRIIIAAHFPENIRFSCPVRAEMNDGSVVELLITERGAVRL